MSKSINGDLIPSGCQGEQFDLHNKDKEKDKRKEKKTRDELY